MSRPRVKVSLLYPSAWREMEGRRPPLSTLVCTHRSVSSEGHSQITERATSHYHLRRESEGESERGELIKYCRATNREQKRKQEKRNVRVLVNEINEQQI